MQKSLLFSILFSAQVFANSPAQPYEQLTLLAQKKQYSSLLSEVASQPNQNDPKLQYFKIAALANMPDKIEDAEELAEKATKQFPSDAGLHRIAANVKFSLAQQASIFSAPGLAKDGLAFLEQAYKLDPKDEKTIATLIGFYGNAPGIVGGDEEKAMEIAEKWQQDNPVSGGLAKVNLLHKGDKSDEAEKLLQQLAADNPQHAEINATLARKAVKSEDYSKALDYLNKAVKQTDEISEKYGYLYEIGRLTAEHNQPAQSGITALNDYIAYFEGSADQRLSWAKARLAKIYLNNQQKELANQLLPAIKLAANDDKNLKKEYKKLTKLL